MNEAPQATAGMVEWLKDRYQPGAGDLVEIVDPRPHVVAKSRKPVLAQIQNGDGR